MLALLMKYIVWVVAIVVLLFIWKVVRAAKATDKHVQEALNETAVVYGVILAVLLVILGSQVFTLPAILLMLAVMTGFMVLFDKIFWKSKRQAAGQPMPAMLDYAWSLFPVFVLVILVRSFIFQPYEVPTGSLEPTVIPVEYLFVTQWNYGLRLPVWGNTVVKVGHPQRGDIALFDWPVNRRYNFVKRVVGVPGDTISYINKTFYINGKEAKRRLLGMAYDTEPGSPAQQVQVWEEDLNGIKHKILIDPNKPAMDFKNLVIPKGQYMMIGDNRDNSDDSRYWGLVPENTFIGKVHNILLSLDYQHKMLGVFPKVRWNRIGVSVNPGISKIVPADKK